jgi:hypothetical protein
MHVRGSAVTAIGTGYIWTGMRDRFGNLFRYAGFVFMNDGARVCFDIYFRASP